VYLGAVAAGLTAVTIFAFRQRNNVAESRTWPEIQSVSRILPQPRQTIIIRGKGFGHHEPYRADNSPYISIRDETAHWAAGRKISYNDDDVTLDVTGWSDSEIVLDGFSGAYDQQGWKLSAGDEVSIVVWNPQSGKGPSGYRVKVF
jgi:hypothetical protein